MVELTRKEYIIIAKGRDIIKSQKISTQELINTLNRHDSRLKKKNYQKQNWKKLLKYGIFQKMI